MMELQADAKSAVCEAVSREHGRDRADRRAVQQMLINLVSNAIKFTPDGGMVCRRRGDRLANCTSGSATRGSASAEDDIGQYRHAVHAGPQRLYARFEGAGLGLSLVKGLVALHHGTMAIESVPGEGTTVTISLPVDGPKVRRMRQVGRHADQRGHRWATSGKRT